MASFRSGSKGWRSGKSTLLPQMWPGFKSWRRRRMWVNFVVGALLCSERFFSGCSSFPLSLKTNVSKFQFDQNQVDEEPLFCGCATSKISIYLFIYLFIYGISDVIATLVITYFHLFLIKRDLRQLCWQRFQISFFDDVVYAQT